MRVVVVGGGLTGLALAWRLRAEADVMLLDRAERVGGQILTRDVAGASMDLGADAMLARQPEAVRLAQDAGVGAELVAPATGAVHLWVRGRLRPLPERTVFGVPTDLAAVARSRVLSPAGMVRAAAEPLLPRRHVVGDRTVADLVGERFGREVVGTLVEPLLGGVYAGDASRLSAAAALPPVWQAAARSRSLLRGLADHRAQAAAASGDRPVFQTLRGGLSVLTDRLARDLGSRTRTGCPVHGLARRDGAWVLRTPQGDLDADHVVLAVPARVAASLLAPVVPEVARELAPLRTASVAVVALAYERGPDATLPPGSGLLVPRGEGWLIKAATFSANKWPHLAGASSLLVRASVGRVGETAGLELDDGTLAERVDAEVRRATGLPRPASVRVVRRWQDALPQYELGHLERVERIRSALRAAAPGLHLAGASYDGVGLAARAREAEQLAATLRRSTCD